MRGLDSTKALKACQVWGCLLVPPGLAGLYDLRVSYNTCYTLRFDLSPRLTPLMRLGLAPEEGKGVLCAEGCQGPPSELWVRLEVGFNTQVEVGLSTQVRLGWLFRAHKGVKRFHILYWSIKVCGQGLRRGLNLK